MLHDFYVDLHCHPTMKPFGKSFNRDGKPGPNNPDRKKKDSVWHYNPPSFFDKVLNQVLKVSKFSQSDFSTSAYGNVRVVCASLYPIERRFCRNDLGKSLIADLPIDFVTGFGKNRIDAIQQFNSAAYCTDLQQEYNFLKELHGKPFKLTDHRNYQYKLVRNYNDLQLALENADASHETIAVVVTIEGAHALGCGIDGNADFTELEKSIKTVKEWEFPPFFVTFAHHFFNELCGHAESLPGLLKKLANQSHGLDTSFTPLGEKVLHELLSQRNGKRILIDIKHMSVRARQRYFEILKSDYNDSVPVLSSHGCVQGNAQDGHKFNGSAINFSDADILRIAETGGLFGLQLDERRIASDSMLRYARSFTKRSKLLYHWSELVWNQVQHIGELLNANGHFAWGNMCLGTDFDGIIDPINGFWTHEDLPDLESYLLMHAHNYKQRNPSLLPQNQIHEEEIVTRIMGSNAMEFFKKHFV